jgi:purine nucleosidase
MSQEVPQPVVIDADIGDDIDDAFALALASSLPMLKVCGITIVCDPIYKRAYLAHAILTAMGQPHIPVALGSSAMSDGNPSSSRFAYQPVLEDMADLTGLYNDTAIDLILRHARENYPLTLIALGPLTNISAALRRDPTLAYRARLVAMAGKIGFPYSDWNLHRDPVAARHVLTSGMATTLVGRNITTHCKLKPMQMRSLFSNRDTCSILLAHCMMDWRVRNHRIPILHDTLTVAVAADPSLVHKEYRRVRVFRTGFSIVLRHSVPNAMICTAVNVPQFHKILDTYLFAARQ